MMKKFKRNENILKRLLRRYNISGPQIILIMMLIINVWFLCKYWLINYSNLENGHTVNVYSEAETQVNCNHTKVIDKVVDKNVDIMKRLTKNDRVYALKVGKDAGKYWKYQEPLGQFGGEYKSKFLQSFKPCHANKVLEFGCGGGFILGNIGNVTERYGVELSALGRSKANENTKINEVKMMIDMYDGEKKFDYIYSTSVLEHCSNPLQEVTLLTQRLAKRGVMFHQVINEGVMEGRDTFHDNPDHELYTWTALNLGNLIDMTGAKVCGCRQFNSAWAHLDLNRMKNNLHDFCLKSEKHGLALKSVHVVCAAVRKDDEDMCPKVMKYLQERTISCDWAQDWPTEQMKCSPY